jgi:hypothetical protein
MITSYVTSALREHTLLFLTTRSTSYSALQYVIYSRPCHIAQSVSLRRGPGSRQGQSVWELRCTKTLLGSFPPSPSVFPCKHRSTTTPYSLSGQRAHQRLSSTETLSYPIANVTSLGLCSRLITRIQY